MPITAVPNDLDLRKISSAQKRALEEYYKHTKETSLLQSTITTIIPSFAFLTAVAGVSSLTLAYLSGAKLPSTKDIVTGAGDLVSDVIVGGFEAVAGKPEPNTPEYLPSGSGPLSRCLRWETDYVELARLINEGEADSIGGTVVRALLVKRVIKNMKKEGCDRPSTIPADQWNSV